MQGILQERGDERGRGNEEKEKAVRLSEEKKKKEREKLLPHRTTPLLVDEMILLLYEEETREKISGAETSKGHEKEWKLSLSYYVVLSCLAS